VNIRQLKRSAYFAKRKGTIKVNAGNRRKWGNKEKSEKILNDSLDVGGNLIKKKGIQRECSWYVDSGDMSHPSYMKQDT
jgi:hypothetical protein